ncbi:MAG: hypothetical protein DRO65_03205 [Candidatus Altiarchaeales archaeon]|nr:MAG: hypothetical protein DRO65_03205 [Candidatus Altiarchaeales archaeon]
MEILQPVYLFSLSFVVGLTGAIIPGPLLSITISESLRKGALAGVLIIIGHILAEILVIAFLILGFLPWIKNFEGLIYLFGGIALSMMSLHMMKIYSKASSFEIKAESKLPREEKLNLIIYGTTFSLFNPSFPLWWLTAGNSLLLYAHELLGSYGLLLALIGHWLSDLVYYSLVSYLVSIGRKGFIKKYVKPISLFLLVIVMFIGIYFIYLGLREQFNFHLGIS